jgi:hypothetical protein
VEAVPLRGPLQAIRNLVYDPVRLPLRRLDDDKAAREPDIDAAWADRAAELDDTRVRQRRPDTVPRVYGRYDRANAPVR